jgi:tripartite-type tricarboxylate transporter receptor subunit TctC
MITRRLKPACLLACMLSAAGFAQTYPDRPIRLIVPFAPGGANDLVARLSGEKLSEQLKQPVTIDNRGGGNAVIGTEIAARAEPDGYTLLMVNINFVINPVMMDKIPYDSARDFAPISLLAASPVVLVAAPDSPITSVKKLIETAKASPGKVAYATSSKGSSTHVPMELLASMAGLEMTAVHYKGGGPAMIDLLAGRVPVGFATMLPAIPYINDKRLRALAVSSATRSTILPEVPTVAEAGVPGYDYAGWWGIVAPAKTPPAIVEKLSAAFKVVQQAPYIKERFGREGVEPRTSSPSEFTSFLSTERSKWTAVAKSAHFRSD